MILPKLVTLNDYNGNWDNYLEVVYSFFVRDFIKEGIFYNEKRVFYISKPFYKNKEFSFWHMITQGVVEIERIPDMRRCERIAWPRFIIENSFNRKVKVWCSQKRNKKKKLKNIIYFAIGNFDYVVVLEIRVNKFIFCTAYPVLHYNRGKIRHDYNRHKKQTPPLKGGIRFSAHQK